METNITMHKFSDDLNRCVNFHGHFCPGLAYGYIIANESLKLLGVNRAEDEEIVLVSECDSCTVDAFQIILGTTIGKGNLIIKDNGKNVYTVYSRKTKKSFRFSKKSSYEYKGMHKDKFMNLERKIKNKTANNLEKKQHKLLKGCDIVDRKCEELFDISPIVLSEPSFAKLDESLKCSECGEYTMSSKMFNIEEKKYCISCARKKINML